mgnify:CR=1 FL=1
MLSILLIVYPLPTLSLSTAEACKRSGRLMNVGMAGARLHFLSDLENDTSLTSPREGAFLFAVTICVLV